MKKEHYLWHSSRLDREMGIAVYGHWGPPLLAFPTSGGDQWEQENQGMIRVLEEYIDAGRVKIFAVNSVNDASFYNKAAHPFHRSYVQRQYDAYVRDEAIPFIQEHCRTPGIPLATMGESFGAYHAVNTLLKHPDVVRRCFGLSGLYDMRQFMDGAYDDNFYFNNPVDYLASLSDPGILSQLAGCDIHIATGSGPWEDSTGSYRLSEVLASRGIRHHLDDWGEQGGHDWAYWHHQMREYIRKLF
jgi:esterase/lipase superfamily enzyme